jgi:hypothetical protein
MYALSNAAPERELSWSLAALAAGGGSEGRVTPFWLARLVSSPLALL